jgi:nitrogen fixation-related uncharacterized protein
MCPNCFPAAGTIPQGLIYALFICVLFFVVAVVAMFVASRNGQLDDLEESKYRMLDD